LLIKWSGGDREALDRLMPLIYSELRRLARCYLRRERPDHTLQTTDLVHETYLKLIGQENQHWRNRAHFFAISAQMMRRILVDYARARQAAKRGGPDLKLTIDEVDEAKDLHSRNSAELIVLDEALNELSALDPQQSRVVELRIFGGLTVEETAKVLNISPRTVKREWGMARAWLRQQITN
jgi:RNA polymerase sigma factor (TIGR02999 family)